MLENASKQPNKSKKKGLGWFCILKYIVLDKSIYNRLNCEAAVCKYEVL